jgi:hypothetical protein
VFAGEDGWSVGMRFAARHRLAIRMGGHVPPLHGDVTGFDQVGRDRRGAPICRQRRETSRNCRWIGGSDANAAREALTHWLPFHGSHAVAAFPLPVWIWVNR